MHAGGGWRYRDLCGKKDGEYTVIISAADYDAEACPGGEDTGSVIKEAYLEFMTNKTLTAPEKLCR